MKHVVICCLFVLLTSSPAVVADAGSKTRERETDPIYRELAKTIRGDDTRSKSARLQLAYAEESNSRRMAPARKAVKTIDGKNAEVVFIRVPANSIPGTDFTMALLLTDGRVVDWAAGGRRWRSRPGYWLPRKSRILGLAQRGHSQAAKKKASVAGRILAHQ